MSIPSNMSDNQDQKVHPWRLCPVGKHFVKEYLRHNPPSKEHPHGSVSTVHSHCATNPTRKIRPKGEVIVKDLLSFDEISYISGKYFAELTGLPTANALKFEHADKYDIFIRGWVHYWNDIFNFKEPLDPNLVKALIASESSFDIEPKGKSQAIGLMQLMPDTITYLQDLNGELKDHFIRVSKSNYLDPSANICAGVRWLFRKKVTAAERLKRDATWIEAVADYKSYLKKMISGENPNPSGMDNFNEYYAMLREKEKGR